jgi:hypothetical protein
VRKCKRCDKEFEPSQGQQKYCSARCRKIYTVQNKFNLETYIPYLKSYIRYQEKRNEIDFSLEPDKELPVNYTQDRTQCACNSLTTVQPPSGYLDREKFDDAQFKGLKKLDCIYCKLQKKCISFLSFYGNSCPAFIKLSRKKLQNFLK